MLHLVDFSERAARNEEVCRDVNREIEAGAQRHRVETPLPFHCECSQASCVQTVALPPKDYERVANERYRFIVLAGHEDPQIERIVEEHEIFHVVEKIGEAREQIDRDHPQQQHRQ
jgi:hypothetical protein